MRRRSFLAQAVSLAAAGALTLPALPALGAAGRPKVRITDIQVKKVRVVRELGTLPVPPGSTAPGRTYRVGGDNVTLISTDAGLTGLCRGVSPAMLAIARQRLIGADPLDVQQLAAGLYSLGGGFNPTAGGADIEIALWDLAGKILEMPLWRLWGGRDGKLMPYASQWTTGTPEERARMAQKVRAAGWRAIKFRAHFPTMKDDVGIVEQTRKLVGDDIIIMVDANQAGESPDGANQARRWDYARALATAREYGRLGVYFLEEPLARHDFEQLAKLSESGHVRIAGGEGSRTLYDFRAMLQQGSLDVVQFEACLIGPTLARQVTSLAAAFNRPAVAHAGFGPGVFCAGHLNASLRNGVFLGPNGNGQTWELIHEPPIIDILQQWEIYDNAPKLDKDGFMQLPDAPGLGVNVRPELLQDV